MQEAKEAVKDAAGDVKDNVKGEAKRQSTFAQEQVPRRLRELLHANAMHSVPQIHL